MPSFFRWIAWLVFMICFVGAAYVYFFDAKFAGLVWRRSNSEEVKAGAELFVRYNCQSCHGEDGRRAITPNYPKIAGQNEEYTLNQIIEIRDGVRTNGGSSYMRDVIRKLTDVEAAAIAKYLAATDGG